MCKARSLPGRITGAYTTVVRDSFSGAINTFNANVLQRERAQKESRQRSKHKRAMPISSLGIIMAFDYITIVMFLKLKVRRPLSLVHVLSLNFHVRGQCAKMFR